MRVVGGRYFFLLNSDAWVLGDGLAKLVQLADEHPEAAVVGPKLLNTDGTLQRSARGEPTPVAASRPSTSSCASWRRTRGS